VREDVEDSRLGKVIKCNECHAMSVATHTPDPTVPGRRGRSKKHGEPKPEKIYEGVLLSAEIAVVLSTGDIPGCYDILDLVFAQASSNEVQKENTSFADVFKIAKHRLAREAEHLEADGVIHIQFDFRTTKSPRALEVLACGTAVKLRPLPS
jgi:hypothetical protein